MSTDYAITYQLPSGNWYTKNCENGAEYIRKLLKRGINEFTIQVWTRAKTIDMCRYLNEDNEYALQVAKGRSYYHTQMGYVKECKINGCHFIRIDGQNIAKSC